MTQSGQTPENHFKQPSLLDELVELERSAPAPTPTPTERLSRVVLETIMAPEHQPELVLPNRYPKSAAAQSEAARAHRSSAVESSPFDRPFDELGGRLQAESPLSSEEMFGEVLQGYQPWMTDVTIAVEDFGLMEIKEADFRSLNKESRLVYSLYLDGFMKKLTNRINRFKVEGTLSDDPLIESWYGKGLDDDDLASYGKTLIGLQAAISSTGIPVLVENELAAHEAKTGHSSSSRQKHLKRETSKAGMRIKLGGSGPAEIERPSRQGLNRVAS